MRRRFRVILFIFLATLVSMVPYTVQADAQTSVLKYSVTVTKFENRAGWHGQWDIGDGWGLVMTDILNQTGRFIVLGESDMRVASMGEQDLAAAGITAQGSLAPVSGQMTPAQILIKGAITNVTNNTSGGFGGVSIGSVTLGGGNAKSEVNVTMYMVDSTTGQILASKSVVGKSNSSGGAIGYSGNGWAAGGGGFKKDNVGKAIESAVQQGTEWMITQLPNIPWTGSVVTTREGKIYINRGLREGVENGQIFSVGNSEILRDPGTGEVLEEITSEIARIEVVSTKEKLSICNVISGRKELITKGMKVTLP